jgi:hypothetical protein
MLTAHFQNKENFLVNFFLLVLTTEDYKKDGECTDTRST